MLYPVGTILYNPSYPTIEKVVAHVATNAHGKQIRYMAVEIIEPKKHVYSECRHVVLMVLGGELGNLFEIRRERSRNLVPVIDIKASHFALGLSVLHWDGGYLVYHINDGYPDTRLDSGELGGALVYGIGGFTVEGYIENHIIDIIDSLDENELEQIEKETRPIMDVFGWLWCEIVEKPMEVCLDDYR